MIQVELIVRDDCDYCDRINDQLFEISGFYPEMELGTRNIDDLAPDRQSIGGITPSIWVNGELWSLGSFDSEKFRQRLDQLNNSESF